MSEQLDDLRHGIGGNKPPRSEVLADAHRELIAEIGHIAAKAAAAPKKVTSPQDKVAIGEIVVPARRLHKRIEAARVAEVEPHLTAQRETNGWFKVYLEQLERLASDLEALATAYDKDLLAAERRRREEEQRIAQVEADRQAEIAKKAAEAGDLNKAARHDDRADAALEKLESLAGPAPSAADVTRVRSETMTASSRTTWAGEITDIAKLDIEKLRPYLKREDLQKALNSFVRVGGRECAGARIFEDIKSSFRG